MQSADDVKGDTRTEPAYIVYPRTCGFSWNCYNQLAYFSNQKYNFDVVSKKPELKKFYEWPEYGELKQRNRYLPAVEYHFGQLKTYNQ